MESSQVFGAEKLSGSGGDSGWTMYIVSTILSEGEAEEASVERDENGEDSADSMASDASSGPSHIEKSRDMSRLRPAEMKAVKKQSKKNKKNKKKNETSMIKDEKYAEEILQHKADSAASHI